MTRLVLIALSMLALAGCVRPYSYSTPAKPSGGYFTGS